MNIPIIKFEVQALKHTMLLALTEYAAKVDEQLQQAVNDYCTEGMLEAVVRSEATKALDACVREEVRNFFGYGSAGRKAVREAVHHRLDELYPSPIPLRE